MNWSASAGFFSQENVPGDMANNPPPPRLRSLCRLVECQVVFVDYMVITASGGGSFGATVLAPTTNGRCTFVNTVIGVEKENMQDRNSVRVRRAARSSGDRYVA